jgi:hypothetical protein
MLLTPAAASPRSLIGLRMESMRAAVLLSLTLTLLSTMSSALPSASRMSKERRRSDQRYDRDSAETSSRT